MSDVYQHDPNRILLDCAIGQVQAWQPSAAKYPAVTLSFYAAFSHVGESESYTSACHTLTIADARSIAAILLRAADHAESLLPEEEAA